MPQAEKIKSGRYFLIGLCLTLAVIAADQITKWMVIETMLRVKSTGPDFWTWFVTRNPIPYFVDVQEKYNTKVFSSILNFVMVWNHGISFGMFDNGKEGVAVIFIGVSLTVSMLLLTWMLFARRGLLVAGLACVAGGAIANAIDRVRFGAVADFIDFHIHNRHWPAFNGADIFISLGAALIIIDAITAKGKGPLDAA